MLLDLLPFSDFIKGFSVTVRRIFRKPLTLEYPEVKRPQPTHFRGRHRLQRYEDGLERCVGCALCAAACPPEAIYLEAKENTTERRVSPGERFAEIYQIHMLRCIWCGFCEEACPEDAIVLGPDWEMSNYSRESLVYNKEQMLDPPEKGFGEYKKLEVNFPL